MGCHDRGSDYNALRYDEVKHRWYASLSYNRKSVEALDKNMVIERIGSGYPGASIDDWDFEQLESGRWKATCRLLLPG